MPRKRKLDKIRILALIIVLLAIAYFYAMIFAPRLIPYYLKAGMPVGKKNILLMGTDFVYDRQTHKMVPGAGHNDTIILAHVDPRSNKINLLSIPRDTLAEIPHYGRTKINAAHFIGGPELAIETVSNFLDVPIDGYFVMNPDVSIKLVDMIGGLRIYVDKDMYYEDKAGKLYINLKKGWHTLSGTEANGYLRYRMDPLGDINRIQRQQNFATALLKKIIHPQNIWRIPMIAGLARESTKTNLSLGELFRLGNLARGLNEEDLTTILVPGDFSTGEAKPCFWIADAGETEKILRSYFGKTASSSYETQELKSDYYVSIFNNTGNREKILPILQKLYKTKYVVSNITATRREDYTKTKILAQKGDITEARALGEFLKIDDIVVSSSGDIISDFTIIICDDYINGIKPSL